MMTEAFISRKMPVAAPQCWECYKWQATCKLCGNGPWLFQFILQEVWAKAVCWPSCWILWTDKQYGFTLETQRDLPKHIHRYPAVCSTPPWDRRRRHKQGRVQGLLAPFCRQCRPSCDSTGRWYCSCQVAGEGGGLPTEDPGQARSSEEKKEIFYIHSGDSLV